MCASDDSGLVTPDTSLRSENPITTTSVDEQTEWVDVDNAINVDVNVAVAAMHYSSIV